MADDTVLAPKESVNEIFGDPLAFNVRLKTEISAHH
jgi:hypothetical protein